MLVALGLVISLHCTTSQKYHIKIILLVYPVTAQTEQERKKGGYF